jgi:hypothetical protein
LPGMKGLLEEGYRAVAASRSCVASGAACDVPKT